MHLRDPEPGAAALTLLGTKHAGPAMECCSTGAISQVSSPTHQRVRFYPPPVLNPKSTQNTNQFQLLITIESVGWEPTSGTLLALGLALLFSSLPRERKRGQMQTLLSE
ncbi:hypothetical protein Mapa_000457 [Marchantia paleacea]|nr:hypothetical protein Mapa_000457 [Marchantia paleacea]